MIKVKLLGMQQLKNKLTKLTSGVKREFEQLNTRTAFSIERDAKKVAPVRFGFLRSGIKTNIYQGGMATEVVATKDYSAYVEYGTRRMKARPFMEPAWEKNKAEYMREIEKLVKAAL